MLKKSNTFENHNLHNISTKGDGLCCKALVIRPGEEIETYNYQVCSLQQQNKTNRGKQRNML